MQDTLDDLIANNLKFQWIVSGLKKCKEEMKNFYSAEDYYWSSLSQDEEELFNSARLFTDSEASSFIKFIFGDPLLLKYEVLYLQNKKGFKTEYEVSNGKAVRTMTSFSSGKSKKTEIKLQDAASELLSFILISFHSSTAVSSEPNIMEDIKFSPRISFLEDNSKN